MHWIALQLQPEAAPASGQGGPGDGRLDELPGQPPGAASAPARPEWADSLTALGWWALQFTPKVARVAVPGLAGPQGARAGAAGTITPAEALLLEVSASERLFGGRQPLLVQIYQSNSAIAPVDKARGATSLIALARLQIPRPLAQSPDDFPLHLLAAALPHLPLLARMGCTRWGQLRALPRDGVARRFGAALLLALDQAYGSAPELYPWLSLPEVFQTTLELGAQVETAPALMFAARRLLGQLHLWLQLRHSGVLALELAWTMDARRNTATQGTLILRTAKATQDMAHLQRLLSENLTRVQLPAPALYLHLRTLHTEPLQGESSSLLPDDQRPGDSLHHMVERLTARLGASQVLHLQTRADHRPEHMQAWVPVTDAAQLLASPPAPVPRKAGRTGLAGASAASGAVSALGVKLNNSKTIANYQANTRAIAQFDSQLNPEVNPQAAALPLVIKRLKPTPAAALPLLRADALYPTWLLTTPLPLAVHDHQPHHHGPLTLLAGPQRLEAGWWVKPGSTSAAPAISPSIEATALRDYFVARSAQAGLLWVYRERLGRRGVVSALAPPTRTSASARLSTSEFAWFLHGVFG